MRPWRVMVIIVLIFYPIRLDGMIDRFRFGFASLD